MKGRKGWVASARFEELRVAKAWGKDPDEWDALSPRAKAQMVGYEEEIADMTEYDEARAREEV